MIEIQVNGQANSVAQGTTVRQLLEILKLQPNLVALELNKRLLKSDRYDSQLQAGDVVEIVTFVGGGA